MEVSHFFGDVPLESTSLGTFIATLMRLNPGLAHHLIRLYNEMLQAMRNSRRK